MPGSLHSSPSPSPFFFLSVSLGGLFGLLQSRKRKRCHTLTLVSRHVRREMCRDVANVMENTPRNRRIVQTKGVHRPLYHLSLLSSPSPPANDTRLNCMLLFLCSVSMCVTPCRSINKNEHNLFIHTYTYVFILVYVPLYTYLHCMFILHDQDYDIRLRNRNAAVA